MWTADVCAGKLLHRAPVLLPWSWLVCIGLLLADVSWRCRHSWRHPSQSRSRRCMVGCVCLPVCKNSSALYTISSSLHALLNMSEVLACTKCLMDMPMGSMTASSRLLFSIVMLPLSSVQLGPIANATDLLSNVLQAHSQNCSVSRSAILASNLRTLPGNG